MGVSLSVQTKVLEAAQELDELVRRLGTASNAQQDVLACDSDYQLGLLHALLREQMNRVVSRLPVYSVIMNRREIRLSRGIDAGHAVEMFLKIATYKNLGARHVMCCEHWRIQ
jgi:hypothetical protein